MKVQIGLALVVAAGALCSVASAQVSRNTIPMIDHNVQTAPRAAVARILPHTVTNPFTGVSASVPADAGSFGTRVTTVYDSYTVTNTSFPGSGDPLDFNVSWADYADYVSGTGSGSAFVRGLWDAANATSVAPFPANNGFAAFLWTAAPVDPNNPNSPNARTDILFDLFDCNDSVWPGGNALTPAVIDNIDFGVLFRNTKTGAVDEPRVLNVFVWNVDPLTPGEFIVEAGITLTYDIPAGFGGFSSTSAAFNLLPPQSITGVEGDLMYDFANVIETTAPCPSDFNGDGFVDDTDFVTFAACYEAFIADPPCDVADFNGDGFVDDTDFVSFAAAYEAFLCPDGTGTVVADGVGIPLAGGRQVFDTAFAVLGPQFNVVGTPCNTPFPLPEEMITEAFGAQDLGRQIALVPSVGSGADATFDGAAGVSYADVYNTGSGIQLWGQVGTTTCYGAGTRYNGLANETARRISVQ